MRSHRHVGPLAARRIRHRVPVALASLLAVVAAGCGPDSETLTGPPTAREPAGGLVVQSADALSFRQVMAGDAHTCGLTTDSLTYCWGDNAQGQHGDGTRTDRSTPVRVASGLRFVQITAGGAHTCALTRNNLAYCWGANGRG